MRSRRSLLSHPAIRTLLFERLLLTGSATLAFAAVAMGHVRPKEIGQLLDLPLLSLLFVLTIAVELAKASGLFDRLVDAVISRARTERGLAWSMIGATGALAAILTNDVALLLVVPFTMLFRKAGISGLAPVVVLEASAANLIGCLTPFGNPQNLFLYTREAMHARSFLAVQAPWVAAAVLALAAAVPLLIPRRAVEPPPRPAFEVGPLLASAALALLALEILALLHLIPYPVPVAGSLVGAALLGRRLREADFSIVVVFAFLFVGVAGLERGRLYELLNPERIFGHRARGLVLSGAVLSQFVSNAPAAMLLAPTVGPWPGLRGLLYGVNAGGCGTPISSIANLIGAQLFLRDGGSTREFWRAFWPISLALLVVMTVASLLLVSV